MGDLGIFDLMLPAFFECLVLVGIHSYLGLHVIRRKVIFVDLALAQVAALGTTVGFLFGMAPDSVAAFIFSVLFTFMAAAVFSVARIENDRVPQEAIIGLVYAIAAAVVILVIDRAPHGAEHIKEVMTGAILWVQWESIIFAAVAYGFVGVIHYIFADKFLLITRDPEEAFKRGMRVRLWDFFFYLTFGIVISISVRTAGVLLVFVFLVVPAITATLITDRLKWQLIIGWTMGVVVTVLGLGISYWADMPSGPTVVSFYGVMLVLAAVFLYVARHRNMAGVLRVLTGCGVVGGALLIIIFGGRFLGSSSLATSRSHAAHSDAHEHHDDHGTHAGHGDHGAGEDRGESGDEDCPHCGEGTTVDELLEVLGQDDENEQRSVVDALGQRSRPLLLHAFNTTEDDGLKLIVARHMARVHGQEPGGQLLLRLLREAEFPFVRSEAADAFESLSGQDFDYSPEADLESNGPVLEAMERWLQAASERRGESSRSSP